MKDNEYTLLCRSKASEIAELQSEIETYQKSNDELKNEINKVYFYFLSIFCIQQTF